MAENDGSTTTRNPREITEQVNGVGVNKFEPTPETIPGNPEPKRQDYRDHGDPPRRLPTPG